jgi:hypothetical protein
MRKTIIGIAVLALLCLGVFALHDDYRTPFSFEKRLGVQRVTHYDPRVNFARIDAMVYLDPLGVEEQIGAGRGGYAPFYPRGTAKIRSSTWYGFPRAQVNINTKDLEPSFEIDAQYEAWLVDAETGYRLSLGTFTTAFGGVGEIWYVANTYFDSYDWVEVTVEPYDDNDVSPGPIVLLGRIPPPTHFNPPPKSSKLVTDTYSFY